MVRMKFSDLEKSGTFSAVSSDCGFFQPLSGLFLHSADFLLIQISVLHAVVIFGLLLFFSPFCRQYP